MGGVRDPRLMALLALLFIAIGCARAQGPPVAWQQASVGWNVPGSAADVWRAISQQSFQQSMVPELRNLFPAAREPWVQSAAFALQYDLWLQLVGPMNTTNTPQLKSQLLSLMPRVFNGSSSEVDVSSVALSGGRSTVTVGIHVWWPAMPDTIMVAAGLPAALRAMPAALADKPSAAALAHNFTATNAFTRRLTNITANVLLPNTSTMAFAAVMVQTQLSGPVSVTVGGTPLPLTRHTDVAVSAAPAPGVAPTFNMTSLLCKATEDSCCGQCTGAAGSQLCAARPVCVPARPLSLPDLLCMAKGSSTPCEQRGPNCVRSMDVGVMSDMMRNSAFQGMQGPNQCIPWSAAVCLSITSPGQCAGACTLLPTGLCRRDPCMQAGPNGSIQPVPCCGGNGCELAPLAADADGMCQRSMNGACELQQVPANCSSAIRYEDKALCELVATVKSTASIQGGVKTIVDNMCTRSVSPAVNILNVCAGGSTSVGCKTCQSMQAVLNAHLGALDAGLDSCGPAYPASAGSMGRISLLRMALSQALSAKHMCTQVADDMMPAVGPQLASQASMLANSSLAICRAVAGPSASHICGDDGTCAECIARVDEFKVLVTSGKASATNAGVLDYCIAKSLSGEDFTSMMQATGVCSRVVSSAAPPTPAEVCGPGFLNLCSQAAASDACRKCMETVPRLQKAVGSQPLFDCSSPGFPLPARFGACLEFASSFVRAVAKLGTGQSLMQVLQSARPGNLTAFCELLPMDRHQGQGGDGGQYSPEGGSGSPGMPGGAPPAPSNGPAPVGGGDIFGGFIPPGGVFPNGTNGTDGSIPPAGPSSGAPPDGSGGAVSPADGSGLPPASPSTVDDPPYQIFNLSSMMAMYDPANQCAAQWSSVMQAFGSGALAPTPYSLYSAMVDLYLSGGDMDQAFMMPQACNPAADTCCMNGLKPSTQEECSAIRGCALAAKCSVAADSCYQAFQYSQIPIAVPQSIGQALGPNQPAAYVCPRDCVLQTGAAADSSGLRPLPAVVYGPTGVSVSFGVCINATQWSMCSSKITKDDCAVFDKGQPACRWNATCAPAPEPPSIGCEADSDACCLSSPTPAFAVATATACTSTPGRSCRVADRCSLKVDMCADKTSRMDCASISTCQFVPTPSGGKCVTAPTANPCAGLGAAGCALNPSCQAVQRCVTNTCEGETDKCCSIPGGSPACSSAGCSSISRCRPTANDCAGITLQEACTSKTHCSWTGGLTGRCIMNVEAHPCATTASACAPGAAAAGGLSCMTQPTCVNPCVRCADCLADHSANIAANLTGATVVGTDAEVATIRAGLISTWCNQRMGPAGAAVCTVLSQSVQTSLKGQLALRPAAVCRAINDCQNACRVPAVGDSSTRVAVDMCTANGRAGGTLVPAPPAASSTCKVDGDCPTAGNWCDLASATQVCSCSDGGDDCQLAGTCSSDKCLRLAPTLAAITAANADRVSCADDDACEGPPGLPPGDYVCQAAAWFTVTCSNALNPLTRVNFTGYCVEAAPSLTASKLSDDASFIQVDLSTRAAPLAAPCSALLTAATVAKIGTAAQCSVGGGLAAADTLIITLMNVPTLIWGSDKLALTAGQSLLKAAGAGARAFAGESAVVATCSSCPNPVANIRGPSLVTKPCAGATSYTTVFFSAAGSSAPAAAPINNIQWNLTSDSATSESISAAIVAANSKSTAREKMVLPLGMADLDNGTPAGDYILQVVVTTVLQTTATATWSFRVASPGLPSVTVDAPGAVSGVLELQATRGIRLSGNLRADSVCGNSTKVVYSWAATQGASAVLLPAAAVGARNLRLDPVDLVAFARGVPYVFTLTALFEGSTLQSTSSMTVTLARSDLTATLRGPMGKVASIGNLTFDATSSQDPDNNAAALKYIFNCEPAPCFKDPGYTGISPQQGIWIVDAAQLGSIDQDYTMKVSVTAVPADGVADNRNPATAFLTVTPVMGNPPTGTIAQSCGLDLLTFAPLPCPSKQNRDQDVQLYLVPSAGYANVAVAWSMVGGATLQEGVNAQGVASKSLTVSAAALPAGKVVFAAEMTAADGAQGRATITLLVNTPPFCPGTSCFALDATTSTFPAFTFTGSVSGWADAEGDDLSYEYGVLSGGAYSSWAPPSTSSTFVFKGFSPGTYQLYACALDTMGARACQAVSITVSPPVAITAAEVTNAVSSITAIDTDQLKATGDPTAVAAKMMEFASLANFAASSNAASTEQVAALADKKSSLLTTLTAVMDKRDPAAMANSLAAAAAVSKGSVSLSPSAGNALLDVVDGLVSASSSARSSSVSSTQITSAASLVVKGVKAIRTAAPRPAQAPSHRRSLLEDAGAASTPTAVDVYNRLTTSGIGLLTLTKGGSMVDKVANGGSLDLCTSALRGTLDGRSVTSNCAAAPTRRRLLQSSGQAAVVLPSGWGATCAADSTCSTAGAASVDSSWLADPASVLAVVQSWPATSILGDNVAETNTELSAASGVLTYWRGSSTSSTICSAGASCNVTLTIPLSASYTASKSLACLLLVPLANVVDYQFTATVTGISLAATSASVANCTVNSWGKTLLVQYTPVAVAGSSPAPQQGAAASSALQADDTALSADQQGTPVTYSFRFANYDYDTMFKKNGVLDNAAVDAFTLAARQAFMAGVAAKTNLSVTNTAGALQLARVQVTSIRAGSVIVDMAFTPPPGADLTALSTAVTSDAGQFFASSSFVARYGTPQVTGTIVKPAGKSNLALAVGVGVGVGAGVLLAALVVLIVARRRRQTLAPQEHQA